jgi:hypothetical protein
MKPLNATHALYTLIDLSQLLDRYRVAGLLLRPDYVLPHSVNLLPNATHYASIYLSQQHVKQICTRSSGSSFLPHAQLRIRQLRPHSARRQTLTVPFAPMLIAKLFGDKRRQLPYQDDLDYKKR